MTPAEMAAANDLIARLERIERKLDHLLNLTRTNLYGEGTAPEKRQRVIDGVRHQFLPGTGWVPDAPPARKRK